MKKSVIFLGFILTLILFENSHAQGVRSHDYNTIGWYNAFLTYPLDSKWSLHGEFQWRRSELIKEAQQNLYRTGVNYQLHPSVLLRGGFAFADTYPYGKVPIQTTAKLFPEYRTYQMIQINNPIGKIALSHRFILEQRWIGVFSNTALSKVNDYVYVNRARYMARVQVPLASLFLERNAPYLAAYDEVMIGFGKNINQNIFDQNRVGGLFGLKLSDHVRMEAGYINQIIQFGRMVEDRELFQHNSGLIWNTYINL
ncbi:Protein of unknown function [Belliella buryatensis]|uniref:DUF2490 domain-containing protein n=1 Tax=Belliella buryatensis TaxID=1500549 RepID=A0A239AC86_9BACT|nr:DUF2490 domain-containing protein [Belliella buryatensis]SNR93225.1 Protein of unknown function [Belliella buryatensis]